MVEFLFFFIIFVKNQKEKRQDMDDHLLEISLQDLRKMLPSRTGDDLSDDFLIAEARYSEVRSMLDILQHPCRLNGYMGLFCIKGKLEVEINLKTYHIGDNSVIINIPGNIARVFKTDEIQEDTHFVLVAVSSDFLSSSRMDYARLFDESISILDNPCFVMSESEKSIFMKYLDLAYNLLGLGSPNMKHSLRGIVSSCLYFAGAVWQEKLRSAPRPGGDSPTLRSKLVLEQFLKLVAQYHDRERGMAFYADKMCMTPKYLSKLIKNVSGKSGPEWIDSFVILEAKNMLKYTDIPIKEIVYKLHFPNSSVFYKFFKSHTGMTPSEYRG